MDPAAPQTTPATNSGEFTQVFASIAPPPTPEPRQPLAFAPSDDDFTKVFSTIPNTGAAAAPQRSPSDEATLIFEQVSAPRSSPPQASPGAFASEAPQPPEMPQSFTSSPVTQESPRTTGPAAGEFTQIFTQVPPPAPLTPEVKEAPAATPSASSEFTQFFSAISAHDAASKPAAPQAQAPAPPPVFPSPAAAPPPMPVAPASSPDVQAASASEFTQLFAHAPALEQAAAPPRQAPPPEQPPARAVQPPPPIAEPGSFTQMFQQIQPPATAPAQQPAQRVAAEPAAPAPMPKANTPVSDAGSFTQMFQQIPPPQAAATPAPPMPPQALPAAPQRPAFQQQPSAEAWPAFGPPAPPQGTFTDVFAARPEPRPQPPSAPPVAPQWPASQQTSQGGGFTELFQAVPAPPPSHPPSSNSFGHPPADNSWPQAASQPPAHAAASPAGGGDFTRLMNSLASPAPVPTAPNTFGQVQPQQTPSMQQEAFFGSPLNASAPAESSEFTRVLRGSAQRQGSAAAVPAAAAPAAPALAAAPAKKEEASGKAPEKKSKTLVILLIVMNVVLVLALILIGFLVLRHK